VRCGLTRGADATAADQATWQAYLKGQGAQVAPQSPLRRFARFWWVPVFAVVLAVGYFVSARRDSAGAIEAGGSLSVAELRVGDCFNGGDEDEFESVDARRCDEAHAYEVFHVATHPGASVYPTDAVMEAYFVSECAPAFATYVGTPYSTSTLYATMITPTEAGWRDGDRGFSCILFEPGADPNGAPKQLTASQRGAAR
jgi:hypothetical protein